MSPMRAATPRRAGSRNGPMQARPRNDRRREMLIDDARRGLDAAGAA